VKTCIQVGLCESAEGISLIKPISFEYSNDTIALPKHFDRSGIWRFFGIDSDPYSISYLCDRHKDIENVHFLCAKIGKTTGISEAYCFWDSRNNVWRQKKLEYSETQILSPVFSMSDLLKFLKITEVDLLIMDIEGAEYDVFEGYDFSIDIHKIYVECHKKDSQSSHSQRISTDNLIKLLSTNYTNFISNGSHLYAESKKWWKK